MPETSDHETSDHETSDQGPGLGNRPRRSGPSTASRAQSLKDAHEADHELLDALGITHPHAPILSVVALLDHLRAEHADASHQKRHDDPEQAGRSLPRDRHA
jgi:hypothetical protein